MTTTSEPIDKSANVDDELRREEAAKPLAPEGEKTTITYERGTAKKHRPDDGVNDAGPRFNDDVPVEVIDRPTAGELSGADADQYEVVFTYSASRGRQHIENTLKNEFEGTLLSDGYAAYARYAEQCEGVTHAQCWTHTRRQFIEAENDEPEAAAQAIALIRQLYQFETEAADKGLKDDKHASTGWRTVNRWSINSISGVTSNYNASIFCRSSRSPKR